MSNREDTKARLAGEIARIVFGEHIVPSPAWTTIDELVEKSFGEFTDKRRQALINDVCKIRSAIGDVSPDDVDGPSGVSSSIDWSMFACVVRDCERRFEKPRDRNLRADIDDGADGYIEARAARAFDDGDERAWDFLEEVSDAA